MFVLFWQEEKESKLTWGAFFQIQVGRGFPDPPLEQIKSLLDGLHYRKQHSFSFLGRTRGPQGIHV